MEVGYPLKQRFEHRGRCKHKKHVGIGSRPRAQDGLENGDIPKSRKANNEYALRVVQCLPLLYSMGLSCGSLYIFI